MTDRMRKLRRCPKCGRAYLNHCVPCRQEELSEARLATLEALGMSDEFLLTQLASHVNNGSLMALFKVMKLKQFDAMEKPPVDVPEQISEGSFVKMLEEMEADEDALDVSMVKRAISETKKLPGPSET